MDSEQTPQKQIGSILSRALAGYTDDYKHEVNGQWYIRWGVVQDDINAVVAAALRAAEARGAAQERHKMKAMLIEVLGLGQGGSLYETFLIYRATAPDGGAGEAG